MFLPIPTKKALRKLGQDIRNARIRRRITMKLMAERASISRTTLTKVEKGTYASVIFVLGLTSHFANLFDIDKDALGRSLEKENLPKRIRSSQRSKNLSFKEHKA